MRGLKSARLGAIGARTGPFQTMRYSEKLLQASGITVVTVDLAEMIAAAGAVKDNDGDLVDLLGEWIPDEKTRDRILADNPDTLYKLNGAARKVGK